MSSVRSSCCQGQAGSSACADASVATRSDAINIAKERATVFITVPSQTIRGSSVSAPPHHRMQRQSPKTAGGRSGQIVEGQNAEAVERDLFRAPQWVQTSV